MSENFISKKIILDNLFAKQRFGIKPGLERTIELCNYVDNPQNSFKSIHVAGTNGKGSVCSAFASVFIENNYTTGIYTSPHLVEFNERISVNNINISDSKIVEYYNLLEKKADEINATFFEITTVMAFLYFAEMHVEIAVIETGMGGRYDSTNVISPLLSIITKIDYDHSEYLGSTIYKIASEKAGIIKKNIPCVVSKNVQEVYDVIFKCSENNRIILAENRVKAEYIEQNERYKDYSIWKIESDFLSGFIKYSILGSRQTENLCTIISALEILNKYFKFSQNKIIDGLKNIRKNTNLRGRIEVFSKDSLVILDGAHNINSINNLFETLENHFKINKWNMIFAVMGDKDIKEIIERLRQHSLSISLPKLQIPRAMDNKVLKNYLIMNGIDNVREFKNVKDAIDSSNDKENLLIFGSFYLIGEVIKYLEDKNTNYII